MFKCDDIPKCFLYYYFDFESLFASVIEQLNAFKMEQNIIKTDQMT